MSLCVSSTSVTSSRSSVFFKGRVNRSSRLGPTSPWQASRTNWRRWSCSRCHGSASSSSSSFPAVRNCPMTTKPVTSIGSTTIGTPLAFIRQRSERVRIFMATDGCAVFVVLLLVRFVFSQRPAVTNPLQVCLSYENPERTLSCEDYKSITRNQFNKFLRKSLGVSWC